MLSELQISLTKPPLVFYDNISAKSLTQNPICHTHIKYIEIDHHFIKEQVMRCQLDIQFMHIKEQLVNYFTKSLSIISFLSLRTKLMVLPKALAQVGYVEYVNLVTLGAQSL